MLYGEKKQRHERPYKQTTGLMSFKAVVEKIDNEKGVVLAYETHSEWIGWDRIEEPSRSEIRTAFHRGVPTTFVIRRGKE